MNKAGETMPGLTRLDIAVPEEQIDCALGLLVRHVSFGWEEQSLPAGRTLFRLHTDKPALLEDILPEIQTLLPKAVVTRQTVENQDWTTAWREFFTPVQAGRFVVLPPWLSDADRGNRQIVIIEPKSAFGTGHHATTALCLEALSCLLDAGLPRDLEALDLGTGSGVLGIACAASGLTVTGTDIDPAALANALENIALNSVQARMRVCAGSTEAVQGQRFGLILANILAAPLRELAPDIKTLLAPGGRLILSGILGVQADDVAACYADLGEPARLEREGWTALIWQRVDKAKTSC
ncbi:MAG: 50S ribosomal protein L11 methyltransferase [Deltaproteobacteria bacterium]|jgi:ribosomal protein L11 methyltransferase|nr:50S ribosomal protein L11 methyltransferase [Deltaproteobacteria bacterium]